MGMLRVTRMLQDGARWEGVAALVDGRVVEQGVWVMPDGQRFEGHMEMVYGPDFIEVKTGFEVHRYALVEAVREGWDFAAEYVCGEDFYSIWGQRPKESGWKLQMAVKGPRKNEVQVVEYAQIGFSE